MFFFNDTATTEIYTLSLHDALPICRRRESGDPVQLGIGLSTYTEICGLAPSQVLSGLRTGGSGWETAKVQMLASGKVEVITGTSPHGQGHVTSWSQIAADALGVDVNDVEILHGDTAMSPYGRDTYGSRSLPVGGVALHLAAPDPKSTRL